MSPTRWILLLASSMAFGAALGVWWGRRTKPEGSSTMTDIHGNSSWTRKGTAWCLGISFAAFIVCAYFPQLQKLAETYITALLNYAAITFGIGKASEEAGQAGFLQSIVKKFTGGKDGQAP